MAKPTFVFVVGTRPDAIKSAPAVLELRKFASDCNAILVSTGQHREMLDQALDAFGLEADHDLALMRHGQTLAELTARCLDGLDKLFCDIAPDYVVAQGDTTTTFSASLAAFYRRIPFGHIEAGLRTDSIDNPFPEEFNRRATGLVATHHFAPTNRSAENLLREGKPEARVFVTGNTGIDAVLRIASMRQSPYDESKARVVLLTTHRRENWGEPQRQIALAARTILEEFEDVRIVAPMHRNPQVRETLQRELADHPRAELIEPPDYLEFVGLMKQATLILTDSGGVQEEAPAFGKPILVLRETTERPEGVEAGTALLVGTDHGTIVSAARLLLSNGEAYAKMSKAISPYGDGHASERIRMILLEHFGVDSPKVDLWA